jgi:hypothetical protein
MGWYASEDGLVHVPTRRDFLDRHTAFLQIFDNVLAEVEKGWDIETARSFVRSDYAQLKAHPQANDCMLREQYFLDELARAHERYRESPKYFQDLRERALQKENRAIALRRSADRAMKAAVVTAVAAWGIEIGNRIAPGLECIVTAENIKWFCGISATTMFAAAVMNYWESKEYE